MFYRCRFIESSRPSGHHWSTKLHLAFESDDRINRVGKLTFTTSPAKRKVT